MFLEGSHLSTAELHINTSLGNSMSVFHSTYGSETEWIIVVKKYIYETIDCFLFTEIYENLLSYYAKKQYPTPI